MTFGADIGAVELLVMLVLGAIAIALGFRWARRRGS